MPRLLVLLAFVLAGCGGAAEAAPEATTEVTMAKSSRFEPQRIEVAAGSTVMWTNEDNFTHSVQVDGRADERVERGGTVSITFDDPGTYHYVCTLHSRDMDGEVVVR